MSLKRLFLAVGLLALHAVSGMNYALPASWLIAEKNKQNTEFDVFYVHPTLLKDAQNPFPDFSTPRVLERLKGFSAAQTGVFGSSARVFVPAVRQLEFSRCMKEMNATGWDNIPENSQRYQAVLDTVAAFRHYLKYWNPQGRRPYILLGHSQGAMDLYELLRQVPEITPQRGFVAAYLAGLPRITARKIEADLGIRGIFPARDEGSYGVVAVWNTQSSGCRANPFTVSGGYGINPLNWRTDTLKGTEKLHRGISLFNHKNMRFSTVALPDGKAPVCSARLDDRGGLIVENLPEEAKKLYVAKDGGAHAGDFWLFAGNIVENARLRVSLYQQKAELEKAKRLIRTGQAECVLLRAQKISHVERGRGISPLLRLYDRDPLQMRGGIVVDKVIGRAAAAIAVCGGASFVHAELMSEDAQIFLKENGIGSSFTILVPRILNRKRDGLCPLEQSVSGISDPVRALASLRKRIAEFMGSSGKK